jgi:hypothetical protein
MKFTLNDKFNFRTISVHRSIKTAVRASYRFSRAVRRANGKDSFIPTQILCDGKPLNERQQQEADNVRLAIETKALRA